VGESNAQEFWLSNLGKANRFNQWVFDQFKDYLGEKVLEVGCGTGTFTFLMAQQGHDVTGIDLHQPFVDVAGERLARFPNVHVVCADATQQAWGEKFDTIVLLDVLEHIKDDVEFLKKLASDLKPGGRLILKVPAGVWLFNGMDHAIGHFRRYSKKSLARTVALACLQLEKQAYFNRIGIAGWWLNGSVLRRVTPPSEDVARFERLVPFLKTVEEAIPIPIGLSLVARAVPVRA